MVLLQEDAAPGVRLLTLNRPERRNALSTELLDALVAALRGADADPAVRAVVVTGAGHEAFCAGGDLSGMTGDGFLAQVHLPDRGMDAEVSVRCGFIDAPELDQPGGTEARNFLLQIIGGREVELVILTKMDTGGIVDRHGRVVAVPYVRQTGRVSANQVSVTACMVLLGRRTLGAA